MDMPAVLYADLMSALSFASAVVQQAYHASGPGVLIVLGLPAHIRQARRRLLGMLGELACVDDSDKAAVLKTAGLGTDVPLKPKGKGRTNGKAKGGNAGYSAGGGHAHGVHGSGAGSATTGTAPAGNRLPFTATRTLSLPSGGGSDGLQRPPERPAAAHTDGEAAGAEPSPCSHTPEDCLPCGHCLSDDINTLGLFLAEVCLAVAVACDRACGLPEEDGLAAAMRSSGTAKARAIHYHALGHQEPLDQETEHGTNTSLSDPWDPTHGPAPAGSPCYWQPWHFDYGLFTGLLGPQYTWHRHGQGQGQGQRGGAEGGVAVDGAAAGPPAVGTTSGPDTHASRGSGRVLADSAHVESALACGLAVLKATAAGPGTGTTDSTACGGDVYDAHAAPALSLCPVLIPEDCVAVQVGEAAQILSGGKLAATPHCVVRPRQAGPSSAYTASPSPSQPCPCCVSRQQFVVFTQPSWGKAMVPVPGQAGHGGAANGPLSMALSHQSPRAAVLSASTATCAALATVLPPLADRWTWGVTEGDQTDGKGEGAAGQVGAPTASETPSPPPTPTAATAAAPAAPSFSNFSKATTGAYFGARAVQATAGVSNIK